MPQQLIDLATFRAEARAGRKPESGVIRVAIGAPKAFDEARRAIRYCFSDGSVDRAGDTISPQGWRIDGFLKNPVALWAHDSWSPPIGRAANVLVEDNRLMGDIEFAAAEIYPFADTIYRLCLGKFINAVSVGFLPIDYSWSKEDDREYGIDFESQELLEISVVPVPCNANALTEARAKGIDTGPLVEWAEKLLDGGGRVILPKAELERLRKGARGPARGSSMTTTRAKPGAQRRDGEDPALNEENPADGGFALNCGQPDDQECSAADPEQCAVHGPALKGGGKAIAAMIKRAVADALKPIVERLKTIRRDGDGDGDGDTPTEPEKCLRAFSAHVKAMGDAADDMPDRDDDPEKHDACFGKMLGHHKDAGDALADYSKAVGLDDHDVSPPDAEDEAAKAARLKRARELRGQATA